MVIMATSQVMLVYYLRPFSNTIESLVLCLCLLVYSTTLEQITTAAGFLLGCLLSLGVFTRVTFVLYGLPVSLAYLRTLYVQNGKHIGSTVISLIPFVIGASFVSAVCIIADSLYYQALKVTINGEPFEDLTQVLDTVTDVFKWPSLRFSGHFVLTPLNNLLYNMDVDNLKQHGLHPRYLHLLVNTPMLYGPLAVGVISAVYGKFLEDNRDDFQQFYYVLLGTIVVPLAGLSSMPHQEARFLTPLLVPLVLTYTWNRDKLYRFFWVIWPFFNIIMTFVFGVLHQGGMMPAMMYVQQQSLALQSCEIGASGGASCHYGPLGHQPEVDFDLTTHLLFYKTYMPPEHLLAYPTEWKKDPDCHVHVAVKDFAGRLDLLEQEIAVREGVDLRTRRPTVPQIDFAPSGEKSYERTLVISPSTAMLPHVEKRRYQLLASLNPHVNFDDAAMLLQAIQEGSFSRAMMGLNVYLLLSDVD
ncbi:Alg9-like mannosyltransferase family-domain-containing protein [Syncephalastrum racemosum]|uniref:Mannosyltransferase n=1 Tax=Syncephalastrum racemosum TaxID=13706 RepID=A0A1X2HSE8_SYNRA|nr:Alg9-like mannosyltransferase family-domain-containing protein [Syncephalastrum racemosum]